LAERFPNVEINCHSADGVTKKIEVSWIVDGKKAVHWSKGRDDTNSAHDEIAKLMKENDN
jgi:hypothetical protein